LVMYVHPKENHLLHEINLLITPHNCDPTVTPEKCDTVVRQKVQQLAVLSRTF
jgi:hypothetical protein